MSRFHTTTIFLLLAVVPAGFCLTNPLRWLTLGILLVVYLVIFALGMCILRLNFFVKATCRAEPNAKHVALTFDDGPDPVITLELLKVLERHEIKAAFFPIGTLAEEHPEIIKQIDQQGHVLGNHSYRHAWWTNFLVGRSLEREIGMAQSAIMAVTGKVPAFYRPPVGLTNPHLQGALRKCGLSVVGWDVRPFDTRASAEAVINRVLKKIRDGSIILLHDGGRHATDLAHLADQLVTEIKARGYTLSGLEKLTGLAAYQSLCEVSDPVPSAYIQAWQESRDGGPQGRLCRFFALLLASTAYVKEAIDKQTNLETFKTRPSPRFLTGVGLVLSSFVLGWPMVGLFTILAAYFKAPVLLLAGPASYGFSHLIWMFGMYLAGRDSIKYIDILFRWGLRKVVERALNQKSRSLRRQ
jgi:peptidoglycan-N-acetylglucosamine deacetylase